jgi:hypothetical protein
MYFEAKPDPTKNFLAPTPIYLTLFGLATMHLGKKVYLEH